MALQRNPNHRDSFYIAGYTDIGWNMSSQDAPQVVECKRLGHKHRSYDNSLYQCRGTDNIVICDECKIFWHYDCSD